MYYVLYVVAAVLGALWLAGLSLGYAMGGLIHGVLILAIAVLIYNMICGETHHKKNIRT